MDEYRPSDTLFKVNAHKLVKGGWTTVDIGVVEHHRRSIGDVASLLVHKDTERLKHSVRVVWIGWRAQDEIVNDAWLIYRYGLLKDDLTDV